MANTLEVGLNTATLAYYAPNNPFKNIILNSEMGKINNAVVSGVQYQRLIYAPSSFPNDASAVVYGGGSNNRYLYTSVSSDEHGWPTSLPYGSVEYYCHTTGQ